VWVCYDLACILIQVEDNWAECDICQKWRRLPGSFVVADGAPFQCSDAGRTCQDAEGKAHLLCCMSALIPVMRPRLGHPEVEEGVV
jgi:hypothetical protein